MRRVQQRKRPVIVYRERNPTAERITIWVVKVLKLRPVTETHELIQNTYHKNTC